MFAMPTAEMPGTVRDDTPFPADTYAQFESEVAELLERDRITDDPAGAAFLTRILIEQEGITSPGARSMLRSSAIRERWNAVFAEARAEQVATWLAPWAAGEGEVLDLLAGDCRLTAKIAEAAGRPLLAAERTEHYDDVIAHPLVRPVPLLDGGPVPAADTVLLGAVLHHEPDPRTLRDLALETGARRFVVVENSIDDRFGPDFHVLMDLFYNRCLNDFGSACTREHRRMADWQELLAPMGELVHQDEMRHVPGLPFPYQLLVFER